MPGARRFRVKDFGYVNASTYGSTTSEPAAIAEMQNEIAARGPIVCSMETNDDHNTLGAWHCYEGGGEKQTRAWTEEKDYFQTEQESDS